MSYEEIKSNIKIINDKIGEIEAEKKKAQIKIESLEELLKGIK